MKTSNRQPKPHWLKSKVPGGKRYLYVKEKLNTLDLHTVCESAKCPNVGECWGGGCATIMIMGDVCTRGCRFCAVKTGNPKGVLDHSEPEHVARAIQDLELDYVVLTSVDRDDLADLGAEHFAKTVKEIKKLNNKIKVEILIPDFSCQPELLQKVIDAKPEVIAHNIEVTRRLTPLCRDKRAGYDTSLNVLKTLKQLSPSLLTKSSIMVGVGERDDELYQTMEDLKAAEVDILTVGQYLRPTPRHVAVDRYFTPEQFEKCEEFGKLLGFKYIAAGPLVRSSYRAGELFVKGVLEDKTK